MHSLIRRSLPERGRLVQRKAHLSLIGEQTKRKVDYSTGKFLLVHASVWSKLFKNNKCSECGG